MCFSFRNLENYKYEGWIHLHRGITTVVPSCCQTPIWKRVWKLVRVQKFHFYKLCKIPHQSSSSSSQNPFNEGTLGAKFTSPDILKVVHLKILSKWFCSQNKGSCQQKSIYPLKLTEGGGVGGWVGGWGGVGGSTPMLMMMEGTWGDWGTVGGCRAPPVNVLGANRPPTGSADSILPFAFFQSKFAFFHSKFAFLTAQYQHLLTDWVKA